MKKTLIRRIPFFEKLKSYVCTSLLVLFLFYCVGFIPEVIAEEVLSGEEAFLGASAGMVEPDTENMTEAQRMEEDANTISIAGDVSLAFSQKLDAVFTRYSTMGASVAVIENGQVVFTHVYGKRLLSGEPVTSDTLFQVGSISKMVAGIGVMQLVEAGNVRLDDDIATVLEVPFRNPQYPNTPITLRQVMSHTAGLRDHGYYQKALYGDAMPLNEILAGERIQYVFQPHFEGGTDVLYSNWGGGLAGCIIEALSGYCVDEYMKRFVFEPMGITAGFQAALLSEECLLADMYTMPKRYITKILRDDPSCITQPDSQRHYFLTAGKLIISAPDLAKLLIALCDGGVYEDVRILKESSTVEMRTLQNRRGTVSCLSERGLYMNIIQDSQVEGRTMYGHGGKAYGMLCAAYFDPTDRTGVVMLTNGCNNRKTYNGVGMLGRAIMRLCYEELLNPTHVTEDPFLVE